MKKMLLILTLSLSFNSFAAPAQSGSFLTSMLSYIAYNYASITAITHNISSINQLLLRYKKEKNRVEKEVILSRSYIIIKKMIKVCPPFALEYVTLLKSSISLLRTYNNKKMAKQESILVGHIDDFMAPLRYLI